MSGDTWVAWFWKINQIVVIYVDVKITIIENDYSRNQLHLLPKLNSEYDIYCALLGVKYWILLSFYMHTSL